MRRVLESASLILNILAFYMIVMLNKKLLTAPSKGGYVSIHPPKSPTHLQKSAKYPQKSHTGVLHESDAQQKAAHGTFKGWLCEYTSAKEPYTSAKEPYISAQEPTWHST